MVNNKKKYKIKYLVGEYPKNTGLVQLTKHWFRKVIHYAHAPLHEYDSEITEGKYAEIIDAFGECIYNKICDGGIYTFPCDHFGRVYVQSHEKNKRKRSDRTKYTRPNAMMKNITYRYPCWNRRMFKNSKLADILLLNNNKQIWDFIDRTEGILFYSNIDYVKRGDYSLISRK